MSASVVGDVAKHYWDLGSIPRSPYNFHIIFSMAFLCSTPRKTHHKPHRSNRPGVIKADPTDKKQGTPGYGVNAGVGYLRKSNELKANGPQFQQRTPIPGPIPPPFGLFFSFHFLFSNLISNLFFILLLLTN